MSGRRLLLSVVLPIAVLAGCADYRYDAWGDRENEVVFGIHQGLDANGQQAVKASYSFIGLAGQGGSFAHVFRDGDGDGACYFERYDQRLGALHVDSGRATWTGGKLPQGGLEVLANTPMPATYSGAGWSDGDTLAFDVSGFAMPPLERVTLVASDLALDGITTTPELAEGASSIAIKSTDDVTVTWTPPTTSSDDAAVLVALETDDTSGVDAGVSCFNRAKTGRAVIPARWVARLFDEVDGSKAIAGHLSVASHSQVTYLGSAGWTAYIVATSERSSVAFAGTR